MQFATYGQNGESFFNIYTVFLKVGWDLPVFKSFQWSLFSFGLNCRVEGDRIALRHLKGHGEFSFDEP